MQTPANQNHRHWHTQTRAGQAGREYRVLMMATALFKGKGKGKGALYSSPHVRWPTHGIKNHSFTISSLLGRENLAHFGG